MTTDEIGASSDAFYSNPEYDRLYKEQSTQFDTAERKEVIQEMIALLQRDLPYIVLTEDPYLEAYNSDAVEGVERLCPAETGTSFCQQVSYEPLLNLEPGAGATESTTTGVPGGRGRDRRGDRRHRLLPLRPRSRPARQRAAGARSVRRDP